MSARHRHALPRLLLHASRGVVPVGVRDDVAGRAAVDRDVDAVGPVRREHASVVGGHAHGVGLERHAVGHGAVLLVGDPQRARERALGPRVADLLVDHDRQPFGVEEEVDVLARLVPLLEEHAVTHAILGEQRLELLHRREPAVLRGEGVDVVRQGAGLVVADLVGDAAQERVAHPVVGPLAVHPDRAFAVHVLGPRRERHAQDAAVEDLVRILLGTRRLHLLRLGRDELHHVPRQPVVPRHLPHEEVRGLVGASERVQRRGDERTTGLERDLHVGAGRGHVVAVRDDDLPAGVGDTGIRDAEHVVGVRERRAHGIFADERVLDLHRDVHLVEDVRSTRDHRRAVHGRVLVGDLRVGVVSLVAGRQRRGEHEHRDEGAQKHGSELRASRLMPTLA